MTAHLEDVDPLRRRIMASVGSKDTGPEMIVRRLLHSMNYRYRLHRKDLPGRPDVAFASRRKAIFVHGCFWHRHPGCRRATSPAKRAEFWAQKFERNVQRDRRALSELDALGWRSMVIWECETREVPALKRRLREFLEDEASATDAAKGQSS